MEIKLKEGKNKEHIFSNSAKKIPKGIWKVAYYESYTEHTTPGYILYCLTNCGHPYLGKKKSYFHNKQQSDNNFKRCTAWSNFWKSLLWNLKNTKL